MRWDTETLDGADLKIVEPTSIVRSSGTYINDTSRVVKDPGLLVLAALLGSSTQER